eukprot:COSAG06_NODE_17083_length_961_cov_42.950116_1_plen_73_part_00
MDGVRTYRYIAANLSTAAPAVASLKAEHEAAAAKAAAAAAAAKEAAEAAEVRLVLSCLVFTQGGLAARVLVR